MDFTLTLKELRFFRATKASIVEGGDVGAKPTFNNGYFYMVDKSKYIEKIREMYMRKTGQEITEEYAQEIFENLVTLVSAVYKPIPMVSKK